MAGALEQTLREAVESPGLHAHKRFNVNLRRYNHEPGVINLCGKLSAVLESSDFGAQGLAAALDAVESAATVIREAGGALVYGCEQPIADLRERLAALTAIHNNNEGQG